MITYKTINLQRADNQQRGKAKYIINGNEYFAEEAAIKHYESLGYNALWTENAYWGMIMSLLFWDVIFAKIQGVVTVRMGGVQTELGPDDPRFEQLYTLSIQTNGIPTDFFSQEFYIRRKNLINNKIEELRHSNIEEKLVKSYQKNYKKPCRPIENWDKYKIDELLISIRRAEKEKFLKILERLISNFKDNRAGLPDLIVYNDNGLFFSEVKSEKDKISDRQKDWHDFLSQALEFNVEICLINQSEDQIKQIE